MTTEERAEREAKVVEAVRDWLPELEPGMAVHIAAVDPDAPGSRGAMFTVTRTRSFTCSRGSR